ncbi:acid-sensing ion channel 4-A-like [Lytechinus variegatus]|uniref:acid-sensing ion channel 4-A-like n=1 Tax=Lytechinus variegatus TaxID=7654 RepID=UPI001BB15814|nr:acid-sensing ion channel 4-A-like [Lytechinus variegatus]
MSTSIDMGLASMATADGSAVEGAHKPEMKKSCKHVLSSLFPQAVGVAGIKFIFNGKEFKIRRLLWGIALLGCLAVMSYQIVNRCVYFSKNPVNTLVEVKYVDQLAFPSVVICNYNSYRKSYIEENEADFATILKQFASDVMGNLDINDTLQEGSLKYTNLTELRLDSAHQLDAIVNAHFDNEELTRENFSLAIFEFGVCYTFNLDNSHRLKVKTPGVSHGLKLILDVQQSDYYHNDRHSPLAAGFQLQALDSQTNIPQVNEYGIAVGPGTMTLIGLTVHETHNLPPPHGKCGSKKLRYYDVYKTSLCRLECQTAFVIKECNCRAPHMPGPERECNPLEIVCMNKAMEKFYTMSSATECSCPVPCDVVTYATTVSQAKFPSEFYSEFLAESMSSKLNKSLDAADIRNDYCYINIFFNELSRQIQTQQEAYVFCSLLSDIGGSLGMWIGGSVLTVCEIIDIIGYSLHKGRPN